jgi:cobalamin-dependent methionine synthase I
MRECVSEALPTLSYRAVWQPITVEKRGACIDFGFVSIESTTLIKALSDFDGAVVFAATVGIGPDRLVSRYLRTSPARALMHQAIGAERVEALCDSLCERIKEELSPSAFGTRVSPGYGDIPLAIQRDLFAFLDVPRRIGVSLTDGLLMSPTKSVTAIIGYSK